MKSFIVLCTLLLAAAASSCSSVTTVAYSNGTIASSEVGYTFEAPQVFRTGRGMRYFVSVSGAPSWEKISIAALQSSGMGRTAERERAKLILAIDVDQVQIGERTSLAVTEGFTPAIVAQAWYQVRYDNVDGEEVSGNSALFTQFISDPNGTIFPTAEEAESAVRLQSQLLTDDSIRKIQATALESALEDAEQLAQRLFSTQEISVQVPVIRNAAGVELETAFGALNAASTEAEYSQAEALYESANDALDAREGGANATSRYGVLCGLAACRLMLNDFQGAWSLTNEALELEPDGVEAHAIRRGIYEEERATGLRAIPAEDRKAMDQQVARSVNSTS